MIKSIFYKQDEKLLKHRFAKALSKENLEFELNHLVSEIGVAEIYEFYIIIDEKIVDNPNVYVDNIVPIFDPEEDYLIEGINENDEEVSVKLSNTEFWIN